MLKDLKLGHIVYIYTVTLMYSILVNLDVVQYLVSTFILIYTIFLFVKYTSNINIFKELNINFSSLKECIFKYWGFLVLILLIKTFILFYTEGNTEYIEGYNPMFLLIGGVFIAPLIEEIIFRGIIQNYLTNKFNYVIGIILTSVIFSLSHLQHWGNIPALLSLSFSGLVLGYFYHMTKNIFLSTGIHMVNNFICIPPLILTYLKF